MRARSYSDTSIVEVEGVQFVLGWIPTGIFELFELDLSAARNAAKRRALIALKKNEALPEGAEERGNAIVEELLDDREFHLAVQRYREQLVRWGVRAHEGFLDSEGSLIPHVPTKLEYQGRQFEGTSDETIRRYGDVKSLIMILSGHVQVRERLGPEQKKSSPSPQGTNGGDGTATIA